MILNVSSNVNDSSILWIGLSLNFMALVELWQVWAIPVWLPRLLPRGRFGTSDELTKRKSNPAHSWSGSPWTCRVQGPKVPLWMCCTALPCSEPSYSPVKRGNICVVPCQPSSLPPILWEVSGSPWKTVCSSAAATYSSWHGPGHLQLIKEAA